MAERKEEFKIKGAELVDKIKEVIKEGNVRKVIIKNEDGKQLAEIPLTFGVLGAVILPALAALGAIVVLAANYSVEVVKEV